MSLAHCFEKTRRNTDERWTEFNGNYFVTPFYLFCRLFVHWNLWWEKEMGKRNIKKTDRNLYGSRRRALDIGQTHPIEWKTASTAPHVAKLKTKEGRNMYLKMKEKNILRESINVHSAMSTSSLMFPPSPMELFCSLFLCFSFFLSLAVVGLWFIVFSVFVFLFLWSRIRMLVRFQGNKNKNREEKNIHCVWCHVILVYTQCNFIYYSYSLNIHFY